MSSLLALTLLSGTLPARADGLVLASPPGTAMQGQCYASGSSGSQVPCLLQGRTWTRALRPTDDADGMNVLGRTLQARAQDEVNVKDGPGGARADNTSDDRSAFQDKFDLAKSSRKNVVIPCGVYIISGTVETYDVGFQGFGEGCVILRSSQNAPIFRSTTTGFGMGYKQIGQFTVRFEVPKGSPYTNTAAIEFAGDGVNYVQDNHIHDILSQGAYSAITVSKGNEDGKFGHESRVSVNTFSRIRATGYTNPGKYRFWFKTGSGTANVFDGMSGGSQGTNYDGNGNTDPDAAVFRYEGRDPQHNPVVVGDITIANSQFQGPNRIVSVGPGSIYNDNINFPGTQFDGVGNPISYDAPGVTPTGLKVLDANIGGGIDIYAGLGTAVSGSMINDRSTSRWLSGVAKNPTNSSDKYFMVEMKNGYESTTCDFTFGGLIGDYGVAYAKVTYAFIRGGDTSAIAPVLIQQSYVDANGASSSSASGAPLTTAAAAPAPRGSGPATATISVVFANRNGGNLIEGQAACSGGTFRLKRLPG